MHAKNAESKPKTIRIATASATSESGSAVGALGRVALTRPVKGRVGEGDFLGLRVMPKGFGKVCGGVLGWSAKGKLAVWKVGKQACKWQSVGDCLAGGRA